MINMSEALDITILYYYICMDDYSFPDNWGNGLKVALILKMGSYMFIELENDYNDLHV